MAAKDIKKLIDNGQYDEASDALINAFATMLHYSIPFANVTKEDLMKVGPTLIATLMGSSDEEEEETEPTKTDAPGDDFVISPSTGILTVRYVGPEDDDEFPPMNDVIKVLNVGQSYSAKARLVPGYTPDRNKVNGTMTAEGATVVFNYTSDNAEESTTTDTATGGGASATGGVSNPSLGGNGETTNTGSGGATDPTGD